MDEHIWQRNKAVHRFHRNNMNFFLFRLFYVLSYERYYFLLEQIKILGNFEFGKFDGPGKINQILIDSLNDEVSIYSLYISLT